MASLTVVKFADPQGADLAVSQLQYLQEQNLIRIRDYATVSWPVGDRKPKTRQAVNLKGAGAVDGAFWGMLFGLIFFVPFLGAAIGAGLGALSGAFTDFGIDDKFVNRVKSEVTEGTSAMFLLSEDAVLDRIADGFKNLPTHELIASNLTSEQEARLKEVFA